MPRSSDPAPGSAAERRALRIAGRRRPRAARRAEPPHEAGPIQIETLRAAHRFENLILDAFVVARSARVRAVRATRRRCPAPACASAPRAAPVRSPATSCRCGRAARQGRGDSVRPGSRVRSPPTPLGYRRRTVPAGHRPPTRRGCPMAHEPRQPDAPSRVADSGWRTRSARAVPPARRGRWSERSFPGS